MPETSRSVMPTLTLAIVASRAPSAISTARCMAAVLPFGGVFAIGDYAETLHHICLCLFEIREDNDRILLGRQKYDHWPFHQMEVQVGEVSLSGTRVQGNRIQTLLF